MRQEKALEQAVPSGLYPDEMKEAIFPPLFYLIY
jgi:hypothetical protein